MTHDDTLSQFEIGTDPFTTKELATISDYRRSTVSGTWWMASSRRISSVWVPDSTGLR